MNDTITSTSHVVRKLIFATYDHTVNISNSYTIGCPPVRGDNPRALARGLSYVQVDNHGITSLYTYISVDLAHHEIFRAKVGKGGISVTRSHQIGANFKLF